MSCVVTIPESRAAADGVSACTAIQFAMNAQTHPSVSGQATSVHQVAATNVIAAG
ncbi:MAG: PE domain-containing protein [Mycobacterium sp.]